jgi:hypothetical protein
MYRKTTVIYDDNSDVVLHAIHREHPDTVHMIHKQYYNT